MQHWIPRGSVVLGVTTFGSYALGLVRDRIFAQTFGAGAALDSYNAAFLIPDFLFNLLVASGIAAAAVPLFAELKTKSLARAYAYMNALLMAAVLIMLVVGVAIIIGATGLSHLVAPGFSEEARLMTAQLMRILAVSSVLFAASNTFGALLVAQKRFFLYGLSPMLYNVGIIAGTVWLVPHFGITGLAWGTVIGAGLHLTIRIIDAAMLGWRWPLFSNQYTLWPEMLRTGKLMLPKMLGHPVELAMFWIFTGLASGLATGSITVLNFARNFQSVPVSLLGIAMSTAVFPSLAEAALGSGQHLRRLFLRTAGIILLASTAAALVVFAIRRPLVAVLLGGGAFDSQAVARTALTLGVFCLAIPTESLNHLLARSFYAVQNTVTPVLFSLISLVIAAGTAYILSQRLGIVGLPLGFFAGSLIKTLGLTILFFSRR